MIYHILSSRYFMHLLSILIIRLCRIYMPTATTKKINTLLCKSYVHVFHFLSNEIQKTSVYGNETAKQKSQKKKQKIFSRSTINNAFYVQISSFLFKIRYWSLLMTSHSVWVVNAKNYERDGIRQIDYFLPLNKKHNLIYW